MEWSKRVEETTRKYARHFAKTFKDNDPDEFEADMMALAYERVTTGRIYNLAGLSRMIQNKAIDKKRKRVNSEVPYGLDLEPRVPGCDCEQQLVDQAYIRSVAEKYPWLVVYARKRSEGMAHNEICEELEMPTQRVRGILDRIRADFLESDSSILEEEL